MVKLQKHFVARQKMFNWKIRKTYPNVGMIMKLLKIFSVLILGGHNIICTNNK